MEKEREMFSTDDIGLAAALTISLGIAPEYKVVNSRVIFCFENSVMLSDVLNHYFDCRLPIDALTLSATLRRLKTIINSKKHGGELR
jgi:hypothetical protein